ncbi:MAG: hypothetical protein A3B89_03990 [Candidatus Buchananbacteria bacterium RIFCSPHIGHO2_02_FULL_40_13]|uniref:Glycosyl transferase family 1 domain-containing protein n=1 Tax=Candidatus Buchananbacteria bacterium RIFCSPLOWO2_01_FULL_39_33 TaxID=1797543 RepID=A0A1G1YLW3_9BACT|nr:MAG: hypothetical protein A2820_02590 [Candidatus Buchananbacteria bacterium RIFCSPHIGHO2_01_FULL_40_35]OGY50719.1 MAG: hypothetical protein A3B89_03990 [Candidatus Buchananbacteria bacterium RIFCSPHIGHO2_02_FULL_40_13]OGY52650.1 MAG: hypothetical protein A3A02_03965 [Candidatus Buchananbacteria bacterium RIFCSPLOWO2_01_FULL_39_33]
MKKTLLVTYFFPPAIGGIESYYLNLSANLPAADLVVLTQNNQTAEKFDSNQKYKIYRTDFFGGLMPPRWWPLKRQIGKIIKEEGIKQLVFGHFHPLAVLGNYFGLPYFLFVHGTDVKQIKNNLWQKIIFKKVYKNCQKIIANSKYLAQEINKIVGDKSKVEVVYPGVNYSVLQSQAELLLNKKQELVIKEDDLVMLSLGRLIKQKNFEAIIKSMPDLLKSFPNLKYVIAGDGPELGNLKDLTARLDLKSRVEFVGPVDNIDDNKKVYYQLADLFVSVSNIGEGFGISYLEAQASGLSVIASKFGGSAEAVIDRQTGILVEPDNLKQIKKAISELLNDKQKRKTYGQAGRRLVRDKFNWSNQVDKIKEILK